MKEFIRPLQIGQQVNILPVKIEYCYPIKFYKEGTAVIVDVKIHGINNYDYGITPLGNTHESGWWYPHSCMELMLDGEITEENIKLAVKTIHDAEREG
jgi:hypothetical protein